MDTKILPQTGDTGTHDPTIVKEGGLYYRFATGRGIPISVSEDLHRWKSAGAVFSANPAWTAVVVPGSGDLWAPEVVRVGDRWRIYYAISTFGSHVSAIGLVTNKTLDPQSSDYQWKDEGLVIQSRRVDDFNAIDPGFVRDFQGGSWLVYGSFWSGIKLRKLDELSGKLSTQDTAVRSLASRSEAPDAIEGAYILPHDGSYFLFVSWDFCCRGKDSTYRIAIGRSDSVEGPFRDRDGRLMTQGGGTILRDGDEKEAGPGHNSILIDQEKVYMVYHVYDSRYGYQSKLRVEELLWGSDGWPLSPSQLKKQAAKESLYSEPKKESQ